MVMHDNMMIVTIYATIIKMMITYYVVYWIFQSELFKRAGYNPWLVAIPFYNSFVQHKIAFGDENKWFWFFSLLFPTLYNTYTRYNYARSFTSVGISVLYLFFPIITSIVLVVSGDTYTGPRNHILN